MLLPPPLIYHNVDIANDVAYATRLMDILDYIVASSSSSSSQGLVLSLEHVRSSSLAFNFPAPGGGGAVAAAIDRP